MKQKRLWDTKFACGRLCKTKVKKKEHPGQKPKEETWPHKTKDDFFHASKRNSPAIRTIYSVSSFPGCFQILYLILHFFILHSIYVLECIDRN